MENIKTELPENLKNFFNKRIKERDERMKIFRQKNSKIDIVGSRLN